MDKKKRRKTILVVAGILVVFGYLIYTGLRDTMTYYLTVTEVLAQTQNAQDKPIRVGGIVSPSSVNWDPKDLRLRFKIEDDSSSLSVYYKGVVPDSFKPGTEVIVEGTYIKGGKFAATTIMPKCASKYE